MSQPPGLFGPLDPASPWPSESRTWSLPRLWWLNSILFVLTLITTTTFGSALVISYGFNRSFSEHDLLRALNHLLQADPYLLRGLIFSIPLLTILMAHEMGHYLVCVNRRVEATFPYFLPSPTLFGTFGAFIRIETPILSRRDLFDIGIAGPVAGFLMLLPFLFVGVYLSHPLPGLHHGSLLIANPYALQLLEQLRFGFSGPDRVVLHPMAVAALAGMMTTALNLLPVGQLDGGHIVYAVFGERAHKIISNVMIGVLVVMGKFWFPWWVWAALLFFLGRSHPLIYDDKPLNVPRRWLALFAVVIFVLCFSLAPTRLEL